MHWLSECICVTSFLFYFLFLYFFVYHVHFEVLLAISALYVCYIMFIKDQSINQSRAFVLYINRTYQE